MQYDDRDLRKLQLLELRILKEIDCVCRELGITYFLDSGSVLGALRHGASSRGMMTSIWECRARTTTASSPRRRRFWARNTSCRPLETNPHQAALFGKVWLRGTRFATEETIEAGF